MIGLEETTSGDLSQDFPIEDIARATRIARGNTNAKYLVQRKRFNDNDKLLFGKGPSTGGDWKEIETYNFAGSPIPNNANILDVEVDPHAGKEERIFISLGGINWGGPGVNRVFTTSNLIPFSR